MNTKEITHFQKTILDRYYSHPRPMPWRETTAPYNILVSEIMLQQTQVSRVLSKYPIFIKQFPTIKKLAKAPLSSVLLAWQGLGYNRRAQNLHKTASSIEREYAGVFPDDYDALLSLPGIGQSTAGALMSFAYNKPVVFIETNIRAVYIHFFFQDRTDKVTDTELLHLITETLYSKNPREWYYALMDYGVYLKATQPNPSRKSKHHNKQSTFKGSYRQKRAAVLRHVLSHPHSNISFIHTHTGYSAPEITKITEQLVSEGLLRKDKKGAWYV